MSTDFDIIIVGAGCAGMQLMRALVQHPSSNKPSILLIDDGQSMAQGKSWCFWHKEQVHVYEPLISKSWPSLEIGTTKRYIQHTIAPYMYSYISSHTFFDYHHQLIQQHPTIQLYHDRVVSIQKRIVDFTVATLHHSFTAKQVYSNQFDPALLNTDQHIALKQSFHGWFVETEKPVFQINCATLMDFRIEQLPGVNFMYVLPFSAHKALVECTSFGNSEADISRCEQLLERYIFERWNTAYFIEKKEQGCIPMTSYFFQRYLSNGAIAIGTAAGKIKSTTGYAMERILQDSRSLADCYYLQQPPQAFKKHRFRFYDNLLLRILEKQPRKGKDIFELLFQRIALPAILPFLDEQTSILAEAKIFANLPTKPFLQSMTAGWISNKQ